jgi:hypothetical protein
MNGRRNGESKKSKIAGRIGIEQGDSLSPFFKYEIMKFSCIQ